MMDPVLYTTSTSTDGADVPMSIKQEPDDGPQTVLNSDHSDVKFSDQQHSADQKICKLEDCKDDIPIINIAPIVIISGCSIKPEEYNLIGKSEPADGCISSGTPTSMNCDVPNVTQNLYEVKNEVKNELPCPIHDKIVHNNRLDVGSELVEVKGEIDCKPEIVGNVVVPGDVNIQTSVQHNDTVNQKIYALTNNCDIAMKEETALDSRTSCPMTSRDIDDSTDPDVDDEKPSHHGSDVQPTNYSNVNKQLSTQDDVIVNVREKTAYTNKDHNYSLCEGTIKSFSCTRCQMHFTSMEEFTSHCETHKTAVEHQCDVCGEKFAQKRNLTQHLRVHSGKRLFKCDFCDKSFTRKGYLKKHLALHVGDRPFKCEVCNKGYVRKNQLTIHLRTHTGERPFKCDLCDKSFTRKGSLKTHLIIHSGERTFKCDVCDKSFIQKGHLKGHLVVHSGERLFICKVCDKSFKEKAALRKHLVIHSGKRPFKCDVCYKTFTQKHALKRHLTIHKEKRPFRCDFCDKLFLLKLHLTNHLRIHWDEQPL